MVCFLDMRLFEVNTENRFLPLRSQLCLLSSAVLCDQAGLSGATPSGVGWGGLPRVPDPHSYPRAAQADLWLTKLCSSHQPFLVDLARRIPRWTVGT